MEFIMTFTMFFCVNVILQVDPVISYGSLTSCGGILSSSYSNITSPNFPHPYPYPVECTWTINITSSTPKRAELHFIEFYTAGTMPDCKDGNYVEVFLGCESQSVGRFCGTVFLPVFYSVDNCMKVKYVSDGINTDQGLNASYITKQANEEVSHFNSGCGTSVFNFVKQGNIFSPKWPMTYPRYVKCYWRVNTREDLMVKVIFMNFDIHKEKDCETSDSLNIRVGGHRGYNQAKDIMSSRETCGRRQPFQMDVHFNSFYLKFESDGARQGRGFMIGFATYRLDEPNEFEPKVLIILGVIFGGMFVLALKIYVQQLFLKTRLRTTKKLRIQIEKMMEDRGLAGRRYRKCNQEPPCDV